MYDELKKEFLHSLFLFRKIKDIMPRHGELTMPEINILNQIYYHKKELGKEVRVSDIQCFVEMTKPALSQYLNTLESKGYILRNIAAVDRRSVALELTEKGNTTLEEGKRFIEAFLDELIDRFGSDNLEQLIALLRRMSETVDEIKQSTQEKG